MNSSNASFLSDTDILTITASTINLVLSLPTNSYIVWLIATRARGMLVAEFFPLNLAVFEILNSLIYVAGCLIFIFPSMKLISSVPFGFLWSGRPLLQCCICIEQFLAVVHPVRFLRYKPLRYKAAFSGVTWAVIIGFTIFYALFPQAHVVFVVEWMVLISVMLFCYFSVLLALKRPRPGEGKMERDNNMKRRAVLTILVTILSFVGTYILWCVAILSQLSTWFTHGRRILTRTSLFITFASGFFQPLLYLQKTGKCSCSKAV